MIRFLGDIVKFKGGYLKMREIPFSLPVSGVIKLDGNSVTVIVNRSSTNVLLEIGSSERMVFEPGISMFDVLLESALEFLRRKKYNRFSGPQLYEIAREKYPSLNKRSFMARLTAATPDHPSYRHHLSRRDFFSRIAPGIYTLENKYLPKNKIPHDANSSDAEFLRSEIH
jgi:hypothetical protein